MGQTWAYEIVLMEDCHMLNEIVKLCQQAILYKFCLQEWSFIYWAIEKSLETNIPKEIGAVFLSKKVFREISSEIT